MRCAAEALAITIVPRLKSYKLSLVGVIAVSCLMTATSSAGENSQGQLGYGNTNTIGYNESPGSVGFVNIGGAAAQIATAGTHTCALLVNGDVRCWGQGLAGQLGLGNTNNIGDNEAPSTAGPVQLF